MNCIVVYAFRKFGPVSAANGAGPFQFVVDNAVHAAASSAVVCFKDS
jgi:hypothetical protein